MPVVQLSLTANEYVDLEKRANKESVSINQFVKNTLFPENPFSRWFPELLHRVNIMPSGTTFNIKVAMGADWVDIPRGIRLALGRVFYQNVAANKIENVRTFKSDSENTQWYIKK